MGLFTTILLALALFFNREVIFAAFGMMFIAGTSMTVLEEQRSKQSKINTVIVISIVTASTFTIDTTGFLVMPFCALGLFIIAYAEVFVKNASIVLLEAVTFSVGIGMSGGGITTATEQFILLIAVGTET